jgi:hypothetical protein
VADQILLAGYLRLGKEGVQGLTLRFVQVVVGRADYCAWYYEGILSPRIFVPAIILAVEFSEEAWVIDA